MSIRISSIGSFKHATELANDHAELESDELFEPDGTFFAWINYATGSDHEYSEEALASFSFATHLAQHHSTLRPSRLVGLPRADLSSRVGIVDWAQFWKETPKPLDWLMPGVVAIGRQTAVWSPPKAGKSIIFQEGAVKWALGQSAFGLPARDPIRVLYIDHENTRDDLYWRLQDMGFKDVHPSNLFYSLLGDWPPLDTPAGGLALEEAVREFEAEVVVIDTTSRTIEGIEDKADTWAAWYRNSGVRLKRMGVTMIRLDHSGKNVERGMRGSSAKASDVDLIVQLSKMPGGVLLEVNDERVKVPDTMRATFLARHEDPVLFHLIEGGIEAKAASRVTDMIRHLDGRGVPADQSYGKTLEQAKEEGWKVGNKAAFGDAQSLRKESERIRTVSETDGGEAVE